MKKQLIKITAIFICLSGILAVCCFLILKHNINPQKTENRLVLLNEIEQLITEEYGQNPADAEIEVLRSQLQKDTQDGRMDEIKLILTLCFAFLLLCMIFEFSYIYFKILRPFDRLSQYAEQIAKGNFDISLNYERTNFFGAFTWAFDHMRTEIISARESETKAINRNKTIIATLSHDIKTPIASIRAYAEGLEANLDRDFEQRVRYLHVIMKKCDEVTHLTNDLILHSLSELERLDIKEQEIAVHKVLQETIQDLNSPYVTMELPFMNTVLSADSKRLSQVILNLLDNAGKYAPGTQIKVWTNISESRYEIHIRDHGAGIPPEDMPFVCDQFYRGKNAQEKPGSGLGLYIVTYIMNRMKGDIILKNHADGLEAVIWLPLSSL